METPQPPPAKTIDEIQKEIAKDFPTAIIRIARGKEIDSETVVAIIRRLTTPATIGAAPTTRIAATSSREAWAMALERLKEGLTSVSDSSGVEK